MSGGKWRLEYGIHAYRQGSPLRVCGRDGLISRLNSIAASPDRLAHVLNGLGGSEKLTIALSVADAVVRAGGQAWWRTHRRWGVADL